MDDKKTKYSQEIIKTRIRSKGTTYAQIARDLGISRTIVSNVPKGTMRSEKVERKIAEILGLNPSTIWPKWYTKSGDRKPKTEHIKSRKSPMNDKPISKNKITPKIIQITSLFLQGYSHREISQRLEMSTSVSQSSATKGKDYILKMFCEGKSLPEIASVFRCGHEVIAESIRLSAHKKTMGPDYLYWHEIICGSRPLVCRGLARQSVRRRI